jgi:thiol-disulfide isomerase/thioredoxin
MQRNFIQGNFIQNIRKKLLRSLVSPSLVMAMVFMLLVPICAFAKVHAARTHTGRTHVARTHLVRAEVKPVGQPAPGFSARTLEGTNFNNASLAGSPTLLQFWTTVCADCRNDQVAVDEVDSKFAGQGLGLSSAFRLATHAL